MEYKPFMTKLPQPTIDELKILAIKKKLPVYKIVDVAVKNLLKAQDKKSKTNKKKRVK